MWCGVVWCGVPLSVPLHPVCLHVNCVEFELTHSCMYLLLMIQSLPTIWIEHGDASHQSTARTPYERYDGTFQQCWNHRYEVPPSYPPSLPSSFHLPSHPLTLPPSYPPSPLPSLPLSYPPSSFILAPCDSILLNNFYLSSFVSGFYAWLSLLFLHGVHDCHSSLSSSTLFIYFSMCKYTFEYTLKLTHEYTHTPSHTYTHTRISAHTHIYIYIHSHTHAQTHINTHTHTHTHTHIHTQMFWNLKAEEH